MPPDSLHLSIAKRNLLQKYMQGASVHNNSNLSVIRPRVVGRPIPLALAQEQVWFRDQTLRGMPLLYNESITVYRRGALDVAALERSVTEIIRRHEIWRTTFDVVNGKPVQIISPVPAQVSLPVIDIRNFPEGERELEAFRLASKDTQQPFNLRHGPLVRFRLLRLSDDEHRLFMAVHQIVLDGVSVYHVFLQELVALYEAFRVGKPSPLLALPIQYADFAAWQKEWLGGEILANQVAYWRKQLAGNIPVLRWPDDRARPAVQTYRSAIHKFMLPKVLAEAINNLAQQEGATLFIVLLTGYSALLHKYTTQDNIIVGTVAPTGRKRSEVKGLIGYFLNPVALRSNFSSNPTFRELLWQVRQTTLQALCHDDVPLEYLTRELCVQSDPSRHALFQVAISLEPPMPALDSGWDLTPMDVESGGGRWDLYLVLDNRSDGMLGRVQYNPDLFDKPTIVQFVEHFQAVLEIMVAKPESRVSDVPAHIRP
jgi:Condensation domain